MLVSRWGDKVEDKWLSMQVQSGSLAHERDSNRASLPRVEYSRGRKINMSRLIAVDPGKKENERKVGPITIAFETVRGQF